MKFRITRTIDENTYEIEAVGSKNKTTVTKKEFHETMNPVGDLYVLKPEMEEKVKQADEIAQQAVVATLGATSTNPAFKLRNIALLASLSEQYCKLLGCTPADFVVHVSKLRENFMAASINEMGASFDEKHHHVPKHLKEKNRSNHNKMKKEDDGMKCSIGDMLKAKKQKEA